MTLDSDSSLEPAATSESAPELNPNAGLTIQKGTGNVPFKRSALQALGVGAAFALVGSVFSLFVIADRVLPHIISPDNKIEFLETLENRPVPELLNWSYSKIGMLVQIRDMSPAMLVTLGILALGGLWLLCIYILNPSFRPVRRDSPPADVLASTTDSTDSVVIKNQLEQPPVDASEVTSTDQPHNQSSEVLDAEDWSEHPVAEPILVELPQSEPEPELVTTPGDFPAAALSHQHLTVDRVHIEQAIRTLLIVGLPVVAVWMLTGGLGSSAIIFDQRHSAQMVAKTEILRYIVLGIALFTGFSIHGLVGKFGIHHRAYLSDEFIAPVDRGIKISAALRLILTGCIFGTAVWGLQAIAASPPSNELLARFQALGTFNRSSFDITTLPYIESCTLVWMCAGLLIFLLGNPKLNSLSRLKLLVLPVAFALLLWAIKRPLTHVRLETKYDASDAVLSAAQPFDPKRPQSSVPSGPLAGIEFAKRLHLQTAETAAVPRKNMVVFNPEGTFEVSVDAVTDDGLITDHSKVPDVQKYLESHDYKTALSWVAIKYIFNDANLRMNTAEALRIALTDLEKCPHLLNTGEALRSMLFLCTASPQNLKLLDEYADEDRFKHPTRDSQRMMGQIYNRFGEQAKAIKWYTRADMPASFMKTIRDEKPMFHTGSVTGKLLWNGAPLSGVSVVVVPQRLNGLPNDLEAAILNYGSELASGAQDASSYYPPFHPRPYRLRWLCGGTQTDANGNFNIQNLTEGAYYLACTLPSEVTLNIPIDSKLTIDNSPKPFTVRYKVPTRQMGTISLKYAQ